MNGSTYKRIKIRLNILQWSVLIFALLFTSIHFVYTNNNRTFTYILTIAAILYILNFVRLYFIIFFKSQFDLILYPKFQHQGLFSDFLYLFTIIIPCAIVYHHYFHLLNSYFVYIFIVGVLIVFILRRTLFPKSNISLLIIEKDYLFVFDKFSGTIIESAIIPGMLSTDRDALKIAGKDLTIKLAYFSKTQKEEIINFSEKLDARRPL